MLLFTATRFAMQHLQVKLRKMWSVNSNTAVHLRQADKSNTSALKYTSERFSYKQLYIHILANLNPKSQPFFAMFLIFVKIIQ